MSTLIFNGQDLADFGVHISGEGTYNAPSRAVEEQIVPGRNGTLIIDGGRWENIIVTYPAYITDDFDDNMAALRNFLTSVRGYARLADTYHPNEFRLAYFSDEITVRTSGRYNAQGQFDLSFNCKPQRFLKSGEESVVFDASDLPSVSFVGNPATFEADGEYRISQLEVSFSPIQDLNGQANPYPPGGGENLFPYLNARTTTAKGVDLVCDGAGKITITGTATANDYISLFFPSPFTVPDGNTYKFCMRNTQANSESIFRFVNGSTIVDSWAPSMVNRETTYSSMSLKEVTGVRIYITSGTTYNMTLQPMLVPKTLTVSGYIPYSNICPITGRTGLTATRANKNLAPNMAGTATNTTNGITFTYNDDGSFTINGTATSNAFSRAVDGVSTKIYLPHGTYKKPIMQNGNVGLYVQYIKSSSSWITVTGGGFSSETFTIDEDYPIVIRVAVQNGTTVNNVRFEPYVYPESVSDLMWVSPVKTNYPISWQTQAGTVYGGTLDVVSGVLTVDRFCKAFDGTETGWTKAGGTSNNTQRYYIPWENMGVSGGVLNPSDALCSHLVFLAGNAGQFGTFNSTVTNFAVKDGNGSQFADINAFKAWLAAQNTNGTPLQICVELSTPIAVYQITPTEVKTLLGGNTIYTDAGGVDGKYLLPLRITNPTAFEAKPIIRIYGAGTVGIGDVNVTFDGSSEYVDLDCELQDAYYGPANKNSAVTLDPNRFPVIPASGAEIVLGSGITQVDITPRWFEL